MSSDFSSEFILTSLRLGKHVEGLVDSYFGPPELNNVVIKEPLKPLDEILSDLNELERRTSSLSSEKPRRTYMQKQIGALKTIAQQKMGKEIPYREFVAKTLDVESEQVKEKEISKIRSELQELLAKNGYRGDLTEMSSAFRKKNLLSGRTLAEEFDKLASAARSRTRALIKLPPSELAELNVVSNKPWGAYNWYLGNYRSRIDLNTDIPISSARLPILVTHEVYPGHHTEHTSKELELYSKRNQLESSILLINTPDCTMSEGVADAAPRFVIGESTNVDDRIQRLGRRQELMVSVNTALLVHHRHAEVDEAKRYFMEEAAIAKEEVDKRVQFVLDPAWRGYIFTYYVGARLVEEAWESAGQAGKEGELLKILYSEENCPTTFKEKVRRLLA